MTDEPPDSFAPHVQDALAQDGFLSPALEEVKAQFIAANKPWFDFAGQMNRVALKAWLNHEIIEGGQKLHDPQPMAVGLFARAMNGFEASVLLLQAGMTVEAGTLIRSLYETGFWIAYMRIDQDAAPLHFVRDNLEGEKGRLKALRRLHESDVAKLDEIARQLVKVEAAIKVAVPKLSIETVAERGEVGSFYVNYKVLCGESAHASLTSARHYLDIDDSDTAGFTIGPDGEGLPRMLSLACHGYFLSMINFFAMIEDEEASHAALVMLTDYSSFQEDRRSRVA